MLINFSIQNFGSIKDKQMLSFEAAKLQHLEDYYVIYTNGLRLLKLALIYGANASGKTTILKALQFLMSIVLEPKEQKIQLLNFEPFLFDPNTSKQNTIFNVDFIQNDTRYFYEIELNQKYIVKEVLSYAKKPDSSKKILNIFERTTDFEKQLTNISFNSEIKIDDVSSRTLVANTLWNNTVLGGFLKTNIELKELMDVTNWFKEYLNPVIYTQTELDIFITKHLDKNKINKIAVLDILRKADFNLSDILIKKEDRDIPDELFYLLKKQKEITKDKIQELKDKGKVTSINLEFEHTVKGKSYSLPFQKESQGTQRYYGFAGLLYLLIKKSTAFPIDELESSLHPDLFQHFLLSFLVNSEKSQLIATTHNREILNNKDIFRNDVIWITDKDNEDCATELYSLADFDTSVIRDTSNIYNAYKIGKLGGTPNLGSYYINIDNETE
ncbi:MAG: ATP-binding protein [Prevotellaceae bacterium]|jgi:AAA15 family ATPase/GTPase|nr:ATP-binding protein [Prevotellaceae bacterium]